MTYYIICDHLLQRLSYKYKHPIILYLHLEIVLIHREHHELGLT